MRIRVGVLAFVASFSIGLCGCQKPQDIQSVVDQSLSVDDVSLVCSNTDSNLNSNSVRDTSVCNGSIGLLLGQPSRQSDSIVWCTAFKVSEGMVLTSPECLPQGFDGQLYFKQPDTFVDSAKAKAGLVTASIVDANPNGDYLWLRLGRVSAGKSLSMSRKGIEPNISYSSAVAVRSFVGGEGAKYSFVLKSVDGCRQVASSVFHPYEVGPLSSELAFSNCPTGQGGVGAPLLDSNGNVVALLRELINGDDLYLFTKNKWQDRGVDIGEVLPWSLRYRRHLLLATNMACVASPGRGTTDCEMVNEDEPISAITNFPLSGVYLSQQQRQEMLDSLMPLVDRARLGFAWKISSEITRRYVGVVQLEPKCFYSDQYIRRAGKRAGEIFRAEVSWKTIEGKMLLNESFQLVQVRPVEKIHRMKIEVTSVLDEYDSKSLAQLHVSLIDQYNQLQSKVLSLSACE